ncbi:hypothetical protein [Streptomyces caniscabiei]|uniref:Uncharacterized protein n=1 Tax=Streptomyces caniscabiei TaxID=2746961 RepID=A0ABU4MJF8_9ACTN|nr:hypothetical protein [Streptomyces caniscabiei]MBE4790980.1 hypothetical protein [Streptomyces caniscabiei]MDX3009607.1 hypothetical protein [Streptomyces caniscabiei]MDX3037252.1 hypothetical protein [Streptomyces caniscabiei]
MNDGQLQLFVCPFGGCDEDGYCPCVEEDVEAYDDQDDEDLCTDRHGRPHRVETVPISIDDYQPHPAAEPTGATL